MRILKNIFLCYAYKTGILITTLVLIIFTTNAQDSASTHSERIQEIFITNNIIKECISKFILKQQQKHNSFKNGLGYIEISGIKIKSHPLINANNNQELRQVLEDTALTFNIKLSTQVLLDNDESDGIATDYYPPFYTYINGYIVLVYDDIFDILTHQKCQFCYKSVFNIKTKRKLQRKIFPYLKQTLHKDFVFTDLFGNQYKLSDKKNLKKKDILKRAAFVYNEASIYYVLNNGKIIERII